MSPFNATIQRTLAAIDPWNCDWTRINQDDGEPKLHPDDPNIQRRSFNAAETTLALLSTIGPAGAALQQCAGGMTAVLSVIFRIVSAPADDKEKFAAASLASWMGVLQGLKNLALGTLTMAVPAIGIPLNVLAAVHGALNVANYIPHGSQGTIQEVGSRVTGS